MFAAVLDTCVLWPSLQRDFVLSMAIEGLYRLDGTFGLPDRDDEHVVAAAVVGGAGAIVTENLKDFPPDLMPAQVHVLSVQEFAADTADVDPEGAARALQVLAERHRNPPRTAVELLDLLTRRYEMTEVGEILGPMLDPG